MTAYHQQRGGIADRIDPIMSAVGGVAAWVGAFIVMALFAVIESDDDVDEGLIDMAGTLLYNAMFVPLEMEGAAELGLDGSINLLTDDLFAETLSIPTPVYQLVPIIVLVGVGFFIAQEFDTVELVEGAVAGASIAIGFVVLSLVGTFIVSPDIGDPDFVMAIVMGIVYPAIFGGVGGAISTQT